MGWEGLEAVMSYEKRVASSKLPRIMVEGFLKDYLGVEAVVARELKSFSGYFLGLFDKKKANSNTPSHEGAGGNKNNSSGIKGSTVEYIDQELYPRFKVWSYLVSYTRVGPFVMTSYAK